MTRETTGDKEWLNQVTGTPKKQPQRDEARLDLTVHSPTPSQQAEMTKRGFKFDPGLFDRILPEGGTVDVTDILKARTRLICALGELPYAAGTQATVTIGSEVSEEEFLDGVTTWLTEFGRTLATVQATAAETQDAYDRIRAQRTAIREFLGTTQRGGDGPW